MATIAPTKASSKTMKVTRCMTGCKHDGQDRLHGSGKRAMNPTAKGYKCTVCNKLQE